MLDVSGDLFVIAADLLCERSQEGGNGEECTEGMLDVSGDLFVMTEDLLSDSSQEGGNAKIAPKGCSTRVAISS